VTGAGRGADSRGASARPLAALGHLAALAALVPPGAHAAPAPTEGSAPPADGPRFVVEYLPPVVYYSERTYLQVGLVNPSDENAGMTVRVELDISDKISPAERPLAPRPEYRLVRKCGRESVTLELPTRGWSKAKIAFDVQSRETGAVFIRRFDEREKLPPLEARGARLFVKDSDEAAILTLTEVRDLGADREWYLVRKVANRIGEGALPASVLILGARLSAHGAHPDLRGQDAGPHDGRRTDELESRRSQASPSAAEGVLLSPWLAMLSARTRVRVVTAALPGVSAEGVSYPILADLAAALDVLDLAGWTETVVWVVACDDARRATPPALVRKCAGFLLHRVRAVFGAGRVVVLFVPEPAVDARRRAVYSSAIEQAARAYKCGFDVAEALASGEFWTVEEEPPYGEGLHSRGRALGRYPNSRGREALVSKVLALFQP
jgi:hypothetical protein